jgi:hypothetical protein
MTTNGTEILEGTVARANGKGIKLHGANAWLNYSRFVEVPHPRCGQSVRVEAGDDGFIRKLVIFDTGTEASAPNSGSVTSPDCLTLRLRVLEIATTTAAAFAQSNEPGKVRTVEIFPLADRMMAWLEQRHTIEDLEP